MADHNSLVGAYW